MTITINIPDMDIALWASFITIVGCLIQVFRFLRKYFKVLYKKIIRKIAKDIAADINSTDKKDEDNEPVEKTDHNTNLKGG